MSTYVPRSQRLGLRPENDGPFDGIPPHLEPQLRYWMSESLRYTQDGAVRALALKLRIPVGDYARSSLLNAARGDEAVLWDIVEGILQLDVIYHSPMSNSLTRGSITSRKRAEVRTMLDLAGSVYTVSDDGLIVERVSEEATETYAGAVSMEDPISDQLRQAWGHAYGRNPDASDAWDHAIKAVEAMLGAIVEPNNTKATLGSMLAVLNNSPQKFRCAYLGRNHDHAIENVIPSLWVIWRNPDRHASGTVQNPTLEEARAVVTLTAALVQTHRDAGNGLVYSAPQNLVAS